MFSVFRAKMFNTNTLHNVINVLILAIAAMATFDWTLFFDAKTAAMVVGGLSLSKLVINAIRDGVSGMVKIQPPVK